MYTHTNKQGRKQMTEIQINGQKARVLGKHNGIQLVERLSDKTQFYYSTGSKKAAISIRGLARLLGCNAMTVQNAGVKLNVFKEHQMYTEQGIQGVKLIIQEDLPKVLTELSTGKKKAATKKAATKLQESLAEAGFRLMVMLEVAPEEVAMEAISRIDDPNVAEKVAEDASIHAQLMRSHIAINYEADKNKLKAGKIVGENNVAFGLAYKGGRHQADTVQKVSITSTQLHQSKALNKMRTSEDNEYSDDAKYAACESIRQFQSSALKAMDDLIDKL